MNKIFEILAKPAKLVLIIGGLVYAVWFAVMQAVSIDGEFMSVLTGIVTLFVGTALIALPPVMLLIKKDELAKLFFVFLLGYWVLTSPTQYFFFAETLASAGEFFPVFISILLFVVGLGIVGILVLVILEILLGLKFLRPIINLIALIVIAASFVTAILFMIEAGIQSAPWIYYVDYALMDMIVLPVTVGFGCLYFFGANEKKGE